MSTGATPNSPAAAPAPPRPVTPADILAERLLDLAHVAAGAPFAAEVRQLADLAAGLSQYPGRYTSDESPSLAALAAATRHAPWSGGLEQEMLSGHVEGRFLAMLVHALQARRVLEIGMFTGYSALAMAEALPAEGVVVACELDAEVADFARAQFATSPVASRIDIRVGPADETLADLARTGEGFDLVFVDADKAGYEGYVRTVLDHELLTPHGLLCIDNTLLQGEPWLGASSGPGAAIARFNDYLAAEARVEQVVVPLRDGVTLARRVS